MVASIISIVGVVVVVVAAAEATAFVIMITGTQARLAVKALARRCCCGSHCPVVAVC